MSNVDRTTTAALFLRKHMIYVPGRRGNPKDPEPRLSAISHARDYVAMVRNMWHSQHAGSPYAHGGGGGGGGITGSIGRDQNNEPYNNGSNVGPDAAASPGPAGSGQANIADALQLDLNHILYYSRGLIPQPQPDLTELIQVFSKHMEVWGDHPIAGIYIITSLKWFVGKRRTTAHGIVESDYHHRVAAMLLALGVIVPASHINVGNSSSVDPTTKYHVRPPSMSLNWSKLNCREFLPSFVSIVSPQSHEESAIEIIYLSHNRQMFEPLPHRTLEGADTDSPFSNYPQQLRRGLLGTVLNLATCHLQQEGQLYGEEASECAIIKLDGVKIVVLQLTQTNCPPRMVSLETKKATRVHSSTMMIMGVPVSFPDSYIRDNVRTILWTLEGAFGPRDLWPANAKSISGNPFAKDNTDNGCSYAFRWLCRLVGAHVMALRDELFLRDDIPHNHRKTNTAMAIGSTPTGSSVEMCGLPSWSTMTNLARPSTHALTKRTCSHATQLTLAAMQAADAFGGALAVVVMHNSDKVMSTAPPAVTSALAAWCATSFHGDLFSNSAKVFPLWMLRTRTMLPAPFNDPVFSVLSASTISGERGGSPHESNSSPAGAANNNTRNSAGKRDEPGSGMHFSNPHSSSTLPNSRLDSDASTESTFSHTSTMGSAVFESNFYVNKTLADQLNAVGAGVSRHTAASLASTTDMNAELLRNGTTAVAEEDIVQTQHYPIIRLSGVGVHVVVLMRSRERQDVSDDGDDVEDSYSSDDEKIRNNSMMGHVDGHEEQQQEAEAMQAAASPMSPLAGYTNSALYRHFSEELEMVLARDMYILHQQLGKHDVILSTSSKNPSASIRDYGSVMDLSKDGGNDDNKVAPSTNGGALYADPAAHNGIKKAGTKTGKTSKPSLLAGVPAGNTAQQLGRGPPSFAYIQDLYLSAGEFIDQGLGMPSSTNGPNPKSLVAEANAFLKEAAVAESLLGSPLHPLAVPHPDSTFQTPIRSLAQEPTTRVILGKNLFSGIKGMSGPAAGASVGGGGSKHAVLTEANLANEFYGGNSALFARRCGGQQSYFATADSNASAWGIEDMYTEYVSKLPTRTNSI